MCTTLLATGLVAVSLHPLVAFAQDRHVVLCVIGGEGLHREVAERHLHALERAMRDRGRIAVRTLLRRDATTALDACDDNACRSAWRETYAAEADGLVLATIARPAPATSPTGTRPVRIDLTSFDAAGAPLGEARVTIPEAEFERPGDRIATAVGALALPAPPRDGRLVVASNARGAVATLDGYPVGEVPLPPLRVSPGAHRLELRAPRYASAQRQFEIAPGQSLRLDMDLAPDATPFERSVPRHRRHRWAIWVGSATALTVLATVLIVMLRDDGSESFSLPPIRR